MTIQCNAVLKLVCTLIIGFLGLAACAQDKPRAAPAAAEVGVLTLQSRQVALQSELPGRTAAYLVSEVRPQVSGIVKERLFNEGADVKAGQVLYRIDPSSYRASYEQGKADVANAEAAVASSKLKDERYAELLQIQGVSKQDADDAHATYLQAIANVALKKAALQSAQINLGYTQVRAPISGRIGKSTVTAGALVTANQDAALATIRALDPMYVDLTQSSAQLLQLRRLLGTQGMQSGTRNVRLKLEDGTEYPQTGALKFQEVSVDEATGSVTLRAQFPNPQGVLLPGMYVRAVLDEAVNNAAVLAPQQAISRDPKGNAMAMVVGSDNKVERRPVVTERALGNDWLVTAGLNPGDRLIVEGLNKVRVGDTVRPVATAMAIARSEALSAGTDPKQTRTGAQAEGSL
jgi:membrane fusion protein (multidrug efflux system)